MKIVLINFNMAMGGAERFLSGFANFLSEKQGVQVTVVLLDKKPIFFELNQNIQIVEPDFTFPSKPHQKLIYFFKTYQYLRKQIKTIKPNSILNFASPAFVLFAIGKLGKVHISIRCNPERVVPIEGYKVPFWIRKVIYGRAASIIAQTEFAKNYLTRQFKSVQVHKVNNFIPTSFKQNSFVTRENVVLFVGRLIKSKGVDFLLRAFSKVNPNDWQLVIVGDGPELNNLIALSKSLNLQNKVQFTGPVSDVKSYYKRAKIFVFPSLSEGFPNSLLEAMASGLACISFDCQAGPSDIIIHNQNGIIVKSGDEETLTSTIKRLIDTPETINLLSSNAIEINETHSIEKIGNQYLQILLKI